MPRFRYKAFDASGKPTSGNVEAVGAPQAIAVLAQQRTFVTEIDEESSSSAAPPAARSAFVIPWGKRRVSGRMRAAMLGQLATALQAGLPLASALQVVREQAGAESLRRLVGDLCDGVEAGKSLSDAMAENPAVFSRLEVSMVRVGETAGVLDEVMASLAEFAEKDLDIREKVHSAAAYPLFLLGLAVISVVVIITLILPRVIGTISEGTEHSALPMPTRVLLAVSGGLIRYGWLLALIVGAGVAGFVKWKRTPQGRLAFDRFMLRLPVLGTAVRRVAVSRFARTLGTLSRAGIQILEALRVLRDTLGNEALAQTVDRVAADIRQGQSIAEPLGRTGQFPPLLIQVIAMGEKTGRLDELLLKTADAYEKETSAAISRVLSILPAMLIVVLALVVAFILAAVLLPIIEMQTTIQ